MEEIVKQDNSAAVEIGRKLKELREAKGMTVEETAEKAGIRPSTLNAIEVGHYNFGIRQAAAVANALGAHIAIMIASERHHDDGRSDV